VVTEQASRARRGEARAKIIIWLNDFFEENKRLPTWTEALAGTTVSAPTLAPTWKNWKADKMKEIEGPRCRGAHSDTGAGTTGYLKCMVRGRFRGQRGGGTRN